MSRINNNTIAVLNDLIRINNDRVAGYTRAESECAGANYDLATLFHRMKQQSTEYILELQTLVMDYGGAIARGTTVMGKIYRRWMDLQLAFSVNDRKNLLAVCEVGEDAAQTAYKMALQETELTPAARAVIDQQKNELRDCYYLLRSTREMEKHEFELSK